MFAARQTFRMRAVGTGTPNRESLTLRGPAGQLEALLEEPKGDLRDYADLYRQGNDYPLPVFPPASFAWARQPDPQAAMQKALAAWEGSEVNAGPVAESADAFVRLALHKNIQQPLGDPLFEHYARRIYGPALEHGGDYEP